MEWILDRDKVLNGSRIATIRRRPLRLAFIVPEDDPQVVLRAIDACCLTWGGKFNALIPYSKTEGFSPSWLTILKKLDPDNLVDCVGISETDKSKFTDRGVHVHRWEKPLDTLFIVGTLQYSALEAFARGITYDVSTADVSTATSATIDPWILQQVLIYQPLSNFYIIQPGLEMDSNPLYLPLLSRYGRLNEDFVDDVLKQNGLHLETRYNKFANVIEHDFRNDTDGIFLSPAVRINGKGGTYSFGKFIDLTTLGISLHSAPYSFSGGTPEDPQEEEAFCDTIVVTGNANSVSDLCLYWNLRIEHQNGFFPLWIPIELLREPEGLQIVTYALSFLNRSRLEYGLSLKPFLYVTSTSMDDIALKDDLDGKIVDTKLETKFHSKDYDRFFSGKYDYYQAKEDREVLFANGDVRVPISYSEVFQHFGSWDRITHEVSFHGVKLPQSIALHRQVRRQPTRITSKGFESFNRPRELPTIKGIHIPDSWTILECIFLDAGYRCEPSDKGKFALGLLHLIGSIQNLRIISSSTVYELLEEICSYKGTKRKYFAERKVYSHNFFRNRLGAATEVILKWLIDREVIFRGITLKCPKCQLSKWYELDRIDKIWRCDGCLSNQIPPLSLSSGNWQYKINELYAMGHDQGFITHLLTIYALLPEALLADITKTHTLGYHPGIKIKAMSDEAKNKTEISEMELDIVSIINGRLIIGECKSLGQDITLEEIQRYAKLANQLQCSRVIFAKPSDLSESRQMFNDIGVDFSAEVEWLDEQDLFDATIRERVRGREEGEENIPKEQKAKTYLEYLAQLLRAHHVSD